MDGEFEGTRVETRVGGIGRADDAPMRKAVRGFHHGGLCALTVVAYGIGWLSDDVAGNAKHIASSDNKPGVSTVSSSLCTFTTMCLEASPLQTYSLSAALLRPTPILSHPLCRAFSPCQ
jgi:hypothetical protein